MSDGNININNDKARRIRSDCEFIRKVIHPFDWTFSTDYKGTVVGNVQVGRCKVVLKKFVFIQLG